MRFGDTSSNDTEEPTADSSTETTSEQSLDEAKDSSQAAPETVAPELPEGVKTDGLRYTENTDGTRNYPDQAPVETEDNPEPQPEQSVETSPDSPQPTSEPVGQ